MLLLDTSVLSGFRTTDFKVMKAEVFNPWQD